MAKPLIHNLQLNLRNFLYKLPDCEQVAILSKGIVTGIGIRDSFQQHFNFVTSKNLIDYKKAITSELTLDVVVIDNRYFLVGLKQIK